MLTINLFNGLVYGALLIIMSSGLALIYGLRRVVNFAHGALYMLGAYIGFSVATHSNFWVALVAAPAVMALLGVLLDRYGFRLLQDHEPLNVMLVTFGLLLILEDLVAFIWGKGNHSLFTPDLAPGDTDTLLDRLVALNAERAAEEATGHIRWLRPDFQNPSTSPTQTTPLKLGSDPGLATAPPATKAEKRPWPATLPEQVRAVADALTPTPQDEPSLAAHFTGKGPWKKRLPEILAMLAALGRAKQSDGGWEG